MFGSPQRTLLLKSFLSQSCVCDSGGLFWTMDCDRLLKACLDNRCASGLCACSSVVFLEHIVVLYFFNAWTRASLKKTDILCHTRTAWQQVGRNLCLFCATMLSSPVSCQNRKGQGRKWRSRKVLPWCMLAGGPALVDGDPPSQEKQTCSGCNPQWDTSRRYFYHFHKAQQGDAFPSCWHRFG